MSVRKDSPVRLRPEVLALGAYRQGRPAAPGGYKLSSNENPFPPLPGVAAAVAAAADYNRYPDSAALTLRQRLADRHGVSVAQVHLGAGSVAVLAQLITAASGVGTEVVYPWRSFEAYPGLVTVAGATGVPVANRPDGSHDIAALIAAVRPATRLLLVCSPNNPTGTTVSRREFATLMDAVPNDLLVVLDEAYAEFVRDDTAVNGTALSVQYPNLVVARTFSKAWGLAGLRLGYGVGSAAVLDAVRAVSIPLSVTEQAQRAGMAALDAQDVALQRVAVIVERRDRAWVALRELGLEVPRPSGNFVWLPTGENTAAAADVLSRHGLIGRAFPPDGIRVTIAEEESVAKLLTACGELVGNLASSRASGRLD